MRQALRVCARGVVFAALTTVAFVIIFLIGLQAMGLASGSVFEALIMPTWLDVATTALVAIAINLVPSSRLRVLPVWAVCTTLIVLRVYGVNLFLDGFAFGPGAFPQDVWATTLTFCKAGIATFVGVFAVGALATVRPAQARQAVHVKT